MKIRYTRLDKELNEIIEEYDFEQAVQESPADERDLPYDNLKNEQAFSLTSNKVLEKTLTSFDLPGMTCSWRGCKFYKVRHGIYARVYFPETLDEAAKNKINNCFTVAVVAAIAAIAGASVTPFTIAGIAAIALAAFETAFVACISDPNVLSILQYHVKYESHRV